MLSHWSFIFQLFYFIQLFDFSIPACSGSDDDNVMILLSTQDDLIYIRHEEHHTYMTVKWCLHALFLLVL